MRRMIFVLLLLCIACSTNEFQTQYAEQLDVLGVENWQVYRIEEVPANVSFGYEKTYATAITHIFDDYVNKSGVKLYCLFSKFVGSSAQQPRSFDCRTQVDGIEVGTHHHYSSSSSTHYKYLKTEADVLDIGDKYFVGDCTVYFIDYNQGYYSGKDFAASVLCGNTTVPLPSVVPES